MSKVIIGVVGLVAGVSLAVVLGLGSNMDDIFVESALYENAARAQELTRCEELESSVVRIESDIQRVWKAPVVWWDIYSAMIAQTDRPFLEELKEGDKSAAAELEKLLAQEGPWPDDWSDEHNAYELFLAGHRLSAWLKAKAASDTAEALKEREISMWGELASILPDLSDMPDGISYGQVRSHLDGMMRRRHATLEEELASTQAKLERCQRRARVVEAKADGASPSVIEALEAELYEVQIGR